MIIYIYAKYIAIGLSYAVRFRICFTFILPQWDPTADLDLLAKTL